MIRGWPSCSQETNIRSSTARRQEEVWVLHVFCYEHVEGNVWVTFPAGAVHIPAVPSYLGIARLDEDLVFEAGP